MIPASPSISPSGEPVPALSDAGDLTGQRGQNGSEASRASEHEHVRFVMVRVFMSNRLAVSGLIVIMLVVLFCFVGPIVYPTNQVATNFLQITLPPSSRFPLGTDEVGYNELGRLMLGGQSSLEVGLAAAIVASVVGTIWGTVAGYVGGLVDAIMMRVVDAILAIPALLLVLLLASFITPSVGVLILVIGFVSWLATARLVRGEVLRLRTLDYVQAGKGFGESGWQVMLRHLVPNVIGVIVVQTTFEVANAILLLAALSFLGLGPPPPAANWGGMLTSGMDYAFDGYWWLIYPAGILIVLTVVAFNVVGDGIRDSVETRLQQR